MDSFTENILARARQRQKLLSGSSSDKPSKSKCDEAMRKFKDTSSESAVDSASVPENQCKAGNNLQKFVRQNSKTRVSSEIPSSPQPQKQTLNIQRDNFNMEIKLTSTDNLRVEVEIEEQHSDDSGTEDAELENSPIMGGNVVKAAIEDGSKGSLRQDAKSRLKQLGKLYADYDEDEWEKPKSNLDSANTPKSPKAHISKAVPIIKNAIKKDSPLKDASPVKKVVTKMINDAEVKDGSSDATKQLKWDRKVLDKLESQGFKRTPSNSRIEYLYSEKNNKNENQPPARLSPIKSSPVKKVTISDRTAFFESNSPSNKQKDPALLSVSERKALFEKNKGAAILPKAPFGMSAPAPIQNAKQPKSTPKVERKVKKESVCKEVSGGGLQGVAGNGVASTVAALMAKKSTISEMQIEESVKKERQKEMELLLNRFHKNKTSEKVLDVPMEEQSDDDNCDVPQETPMLTDFGSNIRKSASLSQNHFIGFSTYSKISKSAYQ